MSQKSALRTLSLIFIPAIICLITLYAISFFTCGISVPKNIHSTAIQADVITSLQNTEEGTIILTKLQSNKVSIKDINNAGDVKAKTKHIITKTQAKLLSTTFQSSQTKYTYKLLRDTFYKNCLYLAYILVGISILVYLFVTFFIHSNDRWNFLLTRVRLKTT